MAISFTRTREQLSRMCLRKLHVLGANESDVSADMTIIYEAIDLRLKEMHRLGTFWRKVDEVPVSFSLSAGSNSASASGDILFPIKMTVSDGSFDIPVYIIGRQDYAAIEDKTRSGLPEKVLWEGGATFRFWPVPSVAATAKLVYERIADDTTAGSAPDVEVSMLRHLRDCVCYDVADDFVQDEDTIQRFERECMRAERAIRWLSAERNDYLPVAVDDYSERLARRESDYGL